MKKMYNKPVMYTEEFALNDSVAACGDESITLKYHCLRGGQPDDYAVFNENNKECQGVPEYFRNITKATSNGNPDFNSVTLTGCTGVYAYCSKTDGSSIATGDDVQWEVDPKNKTTLRHKFESTTNKKGSTTDTDTHDMHWHCMVAPAYGTIEEMKMS